MDNLDINVLIDFKVKTAVDEALAKTKKIKKSVDDVKKSVEDVGKSSGKLKTFDNLKDKSDKLKDSLKSGIMKQLPEMGILSEQLAPALGAVSGAFLAIGAAIVGTTAHFIQLSAEFKKTKDLFRDFEKNESVVSKLSINTKALSETFSRSEEEISKMTISLSKTFGISTLDAIKKVEDAMIATNNKLDPQDIVEFGVQFKNLGASADQFLTHISKSQQIGLFGNKSADAMKNFGDKIKEGSKETKQLLKDVGLKGTDKLFTDIAKGKITEYDAFKKIFKNANKLTDTNQQNLLNGLLGGQGTDMGGIEGAIKLANYNGKLSDLIDNTNILTRSQQKQLNLEKELMTEQEKNSKVFSESLKNWDSLKLKSLIVLEKVMRPLGTFIGALIDDIYTVTENFGPMIDEINKGLDSVSDKMKSALNNSIGNKVKDIFGKDKYDKLKNFLNNFLQLTPYKNPDDLWEMAEDKRNPADDAAKKAAKKVIEDLGINTDNNAQGSSSEVKNIIINLEALQKIAKQVVMSSKDTDILSETLTNQLLQVINNSNQAGAI